MPTIFVYGAVMSHAHVLAHGEAAYVDDHAIRFVVGGLPWIEPAFAAIEPAAGERAWGVVAEWPGSLWSRVRLRETPYVERSVTAVTARGERRDARALFLVGRRHRVEGTPSARYASLLAAGARRFGFPAEVVARYDALEAAGPRLTLSLVRLLGLR